jgi:hypothetical protein
MKPVAKNIWQRYLLSGVSSPSNLILKRIPTENPFLTASRYLFSPMIYWFVLQKGTESKL